MARQDIGRVSDLRLRLLDDLGAAGPGQDLRPLRRSVCSFLERQLGSGRHFSVVAEEREGVVGVGSLEIFERLPHPENLTGKEGYLLNVYVEPEARGRGAATAIVGELVGIAGREGVGRLWLHAASCGRRIYEAAGFEARSVEEMQLVLSG
jgi:GNAT superfamily N-acetyltransferase